MRASAMDAGELACMAGSYSAPCVELRNNREEQAMFGDLADPHTLFFHVRMFLGMIVSFCVVHLMRSYAGILENKRHKPLYWVHQVWVVSTFILLMHFWWWEVRFSLLPEWTFHVYLFIVSYALLIGLFCYALLPDRLHEYGGYREYFYAHRKPLFGCLALIYAVDFVDSYLKGTEFLQSLGPEYIARNAGYIVASLVAIFVANAVYHGVFATAAILYQVSWIARMYERLQ
jgi:hypothetical protein